MLTPQQLDDNEAIEEGLRQSKDTLAYRLAQLADRYLAQVDGYRAERDGLLDEISDRETQIDALV